MLYRKFVSYIVSLEDKNRKTLPFYIPFDDVIFY